MVLLPSMDIYHNVPVSSSLPPITAAQDFSSSMEGDEQDVSLEWLSIFVEDCLSSTTTSFMTLPGTPSNSTIPSQTPKDLNSPSKPRTKRRKTTPNPNPKPKPKPKASCDISHNSTILYDPPLLHQTQWLADSELIFPKKDPLIVDKVEKQDEEEEEEEKEKEEEEEEEQKQQQQQQQQQHEKQQQLQQQQQQARRCSHCLSQRTPQWRAGPLGPKTLCNACGVRFKSGRLLPEYRPAKSPTFVSYKHSNSHKKVMEMRMSIMSTNSISN